MPGYRSGFVAGDPDLIAALKRYRPNVGVAPPEFIQRAAAAAWGDEAHVEDVRELYRAKRDPGHLVDRAQRGQPGLKAELAAAPVASLLHCTPGCRRASMTVSEAAVPAHRVDEPPRSTHTSKVPSIQGTNSIDENSACRWTIKARASSRACGSYSSTLRNKIRS